MLLLLSFYERGIEKLADSLVLLPEVVFICVTMMVFKCGVLAKVLTVWSELSSTIAVYGLFVVCYELSERTARLWLCCVFVCNGF